MTKCFICGNFLTVSALHCEHCDTSVQGSFGVPRLARLTKEEQSLSESLIMHGGNLKEMALALEISYPTLKKKLHALATALEQEKEKDEQQIRETLEAMERGDVKTEVGIKTIRDINHEF